MVLGNPEDLAGGRVAAPYCDQVRGPDRWILGSLVAVGADAHVHGRSGGGPAGQGAACGHVRIVRVGVDGQGYSRDVVHDLGHGPNTTAAA